MMLPKTTAGCCGSKTLSTTLARMLHAWWRGSLTALRMIPVTSNLGRRARNRISSVSATLGRGPSMEQTRFSPLPKTHEEPANFGLLRRTPLTARAANDWSLPFVVLPCLPLDFRFFWRQNSPQSLPPKFPLKGRPSRSEAAFQKERLLWLLHLDPHWTWIN